MRNDYKDYEARAVSDIGKGNNKNSQMVMMSRAVRDSIGAWWRELSLRERWLVMVAVFLVLLLAVYGGVRILHSEWKLLNERYHQATSRAYWVETGTALLHMQSSASENGPSKTIALDRLIMESAAEVGLRLSRNEVRGEHHLLITISAAQPQAIIGWLATLEDQGIIADFVDLTPGTDGRIALQAQLRRP